MDKKTKNIFIAVVSVLVLVLAAVVVFVLINPRKTDREIMVEHLEKSLSGIKELSFKEDMFASNFLEDDDIVIKLYSDTDVKVVEDGEEILYDFEGEGYAKGIEELYGKLLLLENSETVVDLEAVFKDSKLYHKLNNVYSNFYYEEYNLSEFKDALESEGLDLETDLDLAVFVDYLVDTFDEKLEKVDIEREEKEIKLGKEKRTVDKITAGFTEKDLLEMLRLYVKKVGSDKQIKKLLNELVEKELIDEEILDEFNLDDLLDEIDSMIEDADDKRKVFKYSVCLDGKTVVSNEFLISIESDEQDVNIKLVFNSYKNKDNKQVEEVYLSLMGIKMVSFEVEYESKNEYNASFSVYSMFDIEGKVKEDKDSFKAEFVGKMPMYQDDGSQVDEEFFNLVIDAKMVSKDKVTLDLSLDVDYEGVEFDIDSKNELSVNEEMPDVDLSGAKDKENMTDKDKEAYEEIFGESYEYDDEYEYDYDYEDEEFYIDEYSFNEDELDFELVD